MTPAQRAALKAAILADPTLNAYPNTSDGNSDMCSQKLNVLATPAFIVWRGNVTISETGQSFNGTELSGMTTGNQTRLQTIAQYLAAGYNAAKSDVRAMFNDIWSGAGGVTTRANLLVLWKRSATLGEKILATGTGSDASPAALGFEGDLSYQDVTEARSS
tara:strand:- start:345 stop:827 length:483 start_codon:yes stop_codon:yes gene_type:complete